MEVRYVKTGIANNFGSYIELNENLKLYPKLHQSILNHEIEHTNSPGFTRKDLIHDLSEHRVSSWQLLKFMCRHPKAFTQLLPIYKQGDIVFYDINMIITWSVLIIFASIGIFLALR